MPLLQHHIASTTAKYATLIARYVFENSFTASASVEFVDKTSISSLIALSTSKSATFLALSDYSPTIILDG